jgi:hypothetical protein
VNRPISPCAASHIQGIARSKRHRQGQGRRRLKGPPSLEGPRPGARNEGVGDRCLGNRESAQDRPGVGLSCAGSRLTRIVGQSSRLRTRSRAFTAQWAHHSAASKSFGAGGRPHRAGQRRAALHAAMSNVLKIVRCDAVGEWRWIDARDRHPVPAMWTGKEETWQVRRGAV